MPELLEQMGDFFNNRVALYEDVMREIHSADVFYPLTADQLPGGVGAAVLDLGCGTGLELEHYFSRNPTAKVTCIDLAEKMLDILKRKFPDSNLTVIQGSYLEVPFPESFFDGAVSVESLHHFTKEEKTALYRKLFRALKPGGVFVLTDYFAADDKEEASFFEELRQLKAQQGVGESVLCHFDTPLTLAHEIECLTDGGFLEVEVVGSWATTTLLRAVKGE